MTTNNDWRKCECGSGEDSEWQYDGYGIALCKTCSKCHAKQMSKYRTDINEHYQADEQIEADY